MMGHKQQRKQWRRWLTLAAASTALACGGSTVGQPMESNAGAGGATVRSDPPSQAGGTNYPWSGPDGYGASSNGGSTMVPPPIPRPPAEAACPKDIPAAHSACDPSSKGAYECDYNTADPCTATLAWCEDGTWSLGGYDIYCIGQGGSGTGGGSTIPEAGAAGEPSVEPTVSCPSQVPSVGSPCSKPSTVTSYLCDYATGCGSYEATCNGHWLITFQDAPSEACVGGSGGEAAR